MSARGSVRRRQNAPSPCLSDCCPGRAATTALRVGGTGGHGAVGEAYDVRVRGTKSEIPIKSETPYIPPSAPRNLFAMTFGAGKLSVDSRRDVDVWTIPWRDWSFATRGRCVQRAAGGAVRSNTLTFGPTTVDITNNGPTS